MVESQDVTGEFGTCALRLKAGGGDSGSHLEHRAIVGTIPAGIYTGTDRTDPGDTQDHMCTTRAT